MKPKLDHSTLVLFGLYRSFGDEEWTAFQNVTIARAKVDGMETLVRKNLTKINTNWSRLTDQQRSECHAYAKSIGLIKESPQS